MQEDGGQEFIGPSGESHYAFGHPERCWNTGKHLSEERKQKQSQTMRGRESPRKGCKLSDETKEKLRLYNLRNSSRRGKKNSEEHNRRISEAHKGIPLSDDHRNSLKGINLNRIHSRCSCLICRKIVAINRLQVHYQSKHAKTC